MKTCTECGARIESGATACNLCGTPVDEISRESVSDVGRHTPVESVESNSGQELPTQEPASAAGNLFCNQCGHGNPSGSKFCSKCGSALQHLDATENTARDLKANVTNTGEVASNPGIPATVISPTADENPVGENDAQTGSSIVGRQITIIVGAGVLIVLALYMINSLSESDTQTPGPADTQISAPVSGPLTGPFAEKADSLVSAVESSTGEDKIQKQSELLDLYQSATRLDLAAGIAEEIAIIRNTESAWIFAGNLYFDWMDRQGQADVKSAFAQKAIAAYGKALAINPDNLDVRTDMGIAYMYDPTRPMMAIQETMKVLAIDSLHVQANFNRGIMLRQINRIDQAIAQFEKVKRIVGDPNNPVYQRAQAAIKSISSGS